MKLSTAIGVFLVVPLTLGASDKIQPLNIRLGLWQMTYTTERNGGIAAHTIRPELLAKMTPQQRARTKARLKAKAEQGPQVATKQYCLTEEKLKNATFSSEDSRSCRRTMIASTVKIQQFHEECTDGKTKRTADGRFESSQPEALKGSLQVKSTAEDAKGVSTKMAIAGKWLANSCGTLAH
jgi:hypothetical protein